MSHPGDPDELLEIPGDELRSVVGELILGFASGYFSLARSRILSISDSSISSIPADPNAQSTGYIHPKHLHR